MVGSSTEFDAVLDLRRRAHRRIVPAALADKQHSVTTNDLSETTVEHDHHTSLPAFAGETVTRIQNRWSQRRSSIGEKATFRHSPTPIVDVQQHSKCDIDDITRLFRTTAIER